MSRTANTSTEGNYCGRAVHGVSNLSFEDRQQIAAHRAKERPTPWSHLAIRYGVNEIDLRQLFAPPANDDKPEPKPTPVPEVAGPAPRLTERDARFTAMWNAGHPKTDIAVAFGVHIYTVDKMRDRLGLPKRERASKPDDWSAAEAAYVRQYYILKKVSASEVAKHLGRTRHAVIGFAHRQGWARYTIGVQRNERPASHPDVRP